jgi:hypothetical protein
MKSLALGVFTAFLVSAPAVAQERPNFSGTWAAVTEGDPAATAKPILVHGQQFTVRHEGQTLTVTRTFTGGPGTLTYKLDGTDSVTRMPGRLCEADSGATWVARWDGSAIAITMTAAMPVNEKPVKMNVQYVMRLESADTLRVEQTAQTPGQTAPVTRTTLYRKTSAEPAAAPPTPKTAATISQLAWLSGVWSGTSASGTTFEERWTPAAGGSMIGISRTLRDGLMPAFEFLCIVARDGGLVYQAMPNGRMPATDFTLTKIDDASVTFENPAHDFPKMIRYARRPDGSLEAVVSGAPGTKPLNYVFKRAGS